MLQLDLVSETGVIHGAVHAGFYEALFYPLTAETDSIFQKICSALVEALHGNKKKLYITGHSLGAQPDSSAHCCGCLSSAGMLGVCSTVSAVKDLHCQNV